MDMDEAFDEWGRKLLASDRSMQIRRVIRHMPRGAVFTTQDVRDGIRQEEVNWLLYGPCAECGAPRDVVTTVDGPDRLTELVCTDVRSHDASEPALCECGHTQDVHTHLREGTDCSLCECPRFRPASQSL